MGVFTAKGDVSLGNLRQGSRNLGGAVKPVPQHWKATSQTFISAQMLPFLCNTIWGSLGWTWWSWETLNSCVLSFY